MIKFYRGPYASYVKETHGDGIYFAIDKGIIKMNGKDYIGQLANSTAVKSIALNTDGDKFIVTYLDGTTTGIEAASGEYESMIADKNLTTPNAVGGIAKGTKVSSLEGKTFAEMFDDLLFPTVNPTFTAPSASIAWKNYATVQEVGSTGPTVDNFTVGYNAGAINLNGVKQANRGGSHDTANSFIYVNGDATNKQLPTKLALGSTKFKYRAAFGVGPQPKNNKGGDYSSPLAAGTVDSTEISVNGTYPWYASTATAGTLTKQSLVSWNTTAGAMSSGEFTVQPHTAAAPQMFKLPRKASSLQMYNTVAKAFETVALSDWTETSASETVNGNTQTYYTYSYKGDARGSVKLIVKF